MKSKNVKSSLTLKVQSRLCCQDCPGVENAFGGSESLGSSEGHPSERAGLCVGLVLNSVSHLEAAAAFPRMVVVMLFTL